MSTAVVTLPQRASLASAEELVAAAREHASGEFTIDASETTAVDGPAALALVAIAQSLSVKGLAVIVQRPTSAFVDAFTDLGLYEDFMKMELRP